MGSQRRREALRAATQLVSPPPSGQQHETIRRDEEVKPQCPGSQVEQDGASPSRQTDQRQSTASTGLTNETGVRSLSDRQRRSLYNIALRHRHKLLEAPHIIKAGCTSNPEAEFYDAIRDDYVKEGHPPLPSVTKTKEYLRKLSENKRQSRSGTRVKKLLAIRDIKVWQARLMILLDKLVSKSNLRRSLIAIGINLDDVDAANEAMFSATFLNVLNGAYRKCSQRGPIKSSSTYSSDESDDEQSDAGTTPFTPESSTDLSSKAQTPMPSIEEHVDSMELQDASPDPVRQELYKLEQVFKEQCRRDKTIEEPLKSQSSPPLTKYPEGREGSNTRLSQANTTRSETGLFVTQSPHTPADKRRVAEQDCLVKSSASARDEQVLDVSMSIDHDCAPVNSRATSHRAKDDRRKQKQKYRRQRTSLPQTPCPIEDGLAETAQSTSPVTPAASVVLGCERIVPSIVHSVPGRAQDSLDAMRRTPEHQTTRTTSGDSDSSDDPFSSPVRPTRQDQTTTRTGTGPVIQAPTSSAQRSTLERENSEHRDRKSVV